MSKYKIIMKYDDGCEDEQDEVFDTYEEAEEYACYLCGCCREGADILNLSNPGDYPETGDDLDVDFEIIKVKE